MREWCRQNGLGLLLILAVLVLAGLALRNSNDARSSSERATDAANEAKAAVAKVDALAKQNHEAIHALVHVTVVSCKANTPFRVQVKVVKEIEADLLAGLVKLIPVAPVSTSSPTLAQFLVQVYRQDLTRLRIYPVPDCHKLRRQLHRNLLVKASVLGLGPGHPVNVRRVLRKAIGDLKGLNGTSSPTTSPSSPPGVLPAGGGEAGGRVESGSSPPGVPPPAPLPCLPSPWPQLPLPICPLPRGLP